MLPLRLGSGPLHVLALGAHCDDVEIGCGGTLLRLAAAHPDLRATVLVLSGTPKRAAEARAAAAAFLSGVPHDVEVLDLPDGHFPQHFTAVKDALEGLARRVSPSLVLGPTPGDAHQDHRTLARLMPTVWRDQLLLHYEIPKWDGDLGRPGVYVPLEEAVMTRKVDLLHEHYPSQRHRDWFDREMFLGLARVRGMECRARYAEAFSVTKAVLEP